MSRNRDKTASERLWDLQHALRDGVFDCSLSVETMHAALTELSVIALEVEAMEASAPPPLPQKTTQVYGQLTKGKVLHLDEFRPRIESKGFVIERPHQPRR